MRVLFVSCNEGDEPSAYQHRLNSLAAALRARGARTEMMFFGRPGRIFRGPVARQLRAAWSLMPWDDFDFFHAAGPVLPLALSFQRRGRARVVFDCHGLRYAEMDLKDPRGLRRLAVPLMHVMEHMAARRSDLCVSVSAPLIARLAAWRGSDRGIAMVRNGVDTETFRPPEGRRCRERPFVVAYAGAFQKYQAVDLLAGAARLLRDRPDLRWRVIGFAPEDRAVRQSLAATMPAGTELIDRCDRNTLRKLLDDSDLLAVPRRPYLACRVALPTKFAEYLAMGKPVLVNTADETAQIVREHNCGFVAEPNPQAMAEAIRQAATCDDEQLQAMGRAGRRFVLDEMSWDVIGERYRRFLVRHMRSGPGARQVEAP